MKKHKIRNVDIETCCAEQKIAYNYLFSYSINYSNDFEWCCKSVEKNLNRTDNHRYDTKYVYNLFCRNFKKYVDNKTPIFGTYEQIGNFIK